MTRRLIYVVGLIPVALYLGLRWLVTGKDAMNDLNRFEDWGCDD